MTRPTGNGFQPSPQHSVFAHWAINHAGDTHVNFWGHDINTYAVKVGDIIQNNRSGGTVDFNEASKKSNYKSHSALVVAIDTDDYGNAYALTVGGNESGVGSGTVGQKKILLTPAGLVMQRKTNPFISVIETRL